MDKNEVWKSFPELETPRLYLKKMNLEQAQDLLEFWGDDEVTRYTDFESFKDVQKAEEIISWVNSRFLEQNGIRWGIYLKESSKLIGTCGFNSWITDRGNKSVIGYDLHRSYWGKGYMYEALRVMIPYGFQEMKLHRIEADVDPANIGSQKLLEKLHFTKEGCLRDNGYWKGQYWTTLIYGLLENEF